MGQVSCSAMGHIREHAAASGRASIPVLFSLGSPPMSTGGSWLQHRLLPWCGMRRTGWDGMGRDGTSWEGTGRDGKGWNGTAPARFSHFQCQGWAAGAACSPKGPPHEERVGSPAPGAVNYSLHPNGSSLDGLAEPARCCPVCRALTSAEELVLASLQLLQSCFSVCA